ncbi:MAG: hypothetical protein ACRYFK_18950 [Janthinobacterium lividum]
MQLLLTLGAGLLALATQPARAQDTLAAQRHPLLLNFKGDFSLITYTHGGYISRRRFRSFSNRAS